MNGGGPFEMLCDCHRAAMFLQAANSTLGLASSLATSSNNSENLLLPLPPPESTERMHDRTTDAVYALFAF